MGDTELDEAFPVAEGQVGLGVDIVEIARVRRILERTPSFRERVFSEEERAYCDAAANPEVHYATRFAAKEAVVKALGTGFTRGIGVRDIEDIYLPMGFSQFKIEGRSLGSALVLEFLLHYMTRPEYHLNVREEIYLDNTLDLF